MKGHIETTAAQLEHLMEWGADGPVAMLNLLRFREIADYSEAPDLAPETGISGRQAYDLYAEGVLPILAALGGEPLLFGPCLPILIGPAEERWDDIAVIRYPTLDSFTTMVSSPDYLAIMGRRTAALLDSRLVPTHAVSP